MSVFSFPFNDRIRRQPCYAEKSSVGRDAAAEAEETIPQERLPWECEDRGRMTLSVPHRIECKPCRHNQGVGIIGELTKEFSEQNAGFEPEDVELMLCCLTGRLPLSEDTTDQSESGEL